MRSKSLPIIFVRLSFPSAMVSCLPMKDADTSSAVCCAVQFVMARCSASIGRSCHQLTAVVGDIMGVYYPEVVEKREFIEKVIRTEEERFHETLIGWLGILVRWLTETRVKRRTATRSAGADAFKLYDTYGFPFDLTEDFAAEQGMTVDRAGFDAAMEEQRDRARAARQDSGQHEGTRRTAF